MDDGRDVCGCALTRILMTDSYRPYPAPSGAPTMFQSWHDLLFMHWRVPVAALRPLIPATLTIDTFDGDAWLAVVPFRMSDIHPRGLFSVPWLSAFAELNVRTYVTAGGRPGVWFFSLDAANPLAVWIARTWFKLPYFNAQMRCDQRTGGAISYVSVRTHRNAPPAELRMRYAPSGDVFEAAPGALEYFLTARYCLYTAHHDTVYRGEIDHAPWPLQHATADIDRNTMPAAHSLRVPDSAPHLLFARDIDVRVWGLEKLKE
jgi:uncharacterized protein